MVDGLNRVMLLGNLGQDPELKMTQGGQAILKIRMATAESYLDKSNTRQERTEWHTCTVWGKRAEALAKILTKGSKIFVEGSIHTSSYEKNGEKRYSTEINVSNIILAGGGARDGAEQRSFGGDASNGGGGGGTRGCGGSGGSRAPSRGAPDESDYGGGNTGGDDEIPF